MLDSLPLFYLFFIIFLFFYYLFQVRSLRMSGSCALNLCGIACGRLDLFYELGFGGPWYDLILFLSSLVFIVQTTVLTLFSPCP